MIYLDNHATTPLDPRVFEVIRPFFEAEYGNAASNSHAYGWRAQAAVDKARASVARLIGARSDEIVFTSGATESNNWALLSNLNPGDHLITSAIEHKSVLCVAEHLEKRGVVVTYLMPDSLGRISSNDVTRSITPRTKMISIMMANNEIGSILPIAEIALLAKSHDVLFHCDAAQGPLSDTGLGVDLLSLSAHKMYGPKGIGALFVRQGLAMRPLMFGGGGERAGTLNVPAIVGFGAAADILMDEAEAENKRVLTLRDRLLNALQAIPGIQINGSLENRLPGNLNISFVGIDGELMLLAVQNKVALSVGAACSSSDAKGSHVLKAIGVPPERIQSSFRIGIGRFNTAEEIDKAAHALILAHARAKC